MWGEVVRSRIIATVAALAVSVTPSGAAGQAPTASPPPAASARPVLVTSEGGTPVSARPMVVVDGTLYFSATGPRSVDGRRRALWRTDGTRNGTWPVPICRTELVCGLPQPIRAAGAVGDRLVFSTGDNLWRSDGTRGGTRIIAKGTGRTHWPGPIGRQMPMQHGICDWAGDETRAFVIAAYDCYDSYRQLWRTDGTRAGTTLLRWFPYVQALTLTGGRAFLVTWSDGPVRSLLWVSDGTRAGTSRLRGFARVERGPHGGLVAWGDGRVAMAADDGSHGTELWISDGTVAGTRLVRDIRSPASEPRRSQPEMTAGSVPSMLTVVGDRLWFTADDGIHGRELWIADGTREGTTRAAATAPGLADLVPCVARPMGATTIVLGTDRQGRTGLWRTDGTPEGTTSLARLGELPPPQPDEVDGEDGEDGESATPTDDELCARSLLDRSGATRVGDALVLVAQDIAGPRLWRTDGTVAGTGVLHRFEPDGGQWWNTQTVTADGVVWLTSPGASSDLWRTDGTPDGTRPVVDGPVGQPVISGGRLYITGGALTPDAPEACGRSRCLWTLELESAAGPGAEATPPVSPTPSASPGSGQPTGATELLAGFPARIGGRPIHPIAWTGREWLTGYDADRPEDAAAIASVERFVRSLGATIDDLEVAFTLHARTWEMTAIMAIRVRGVRPAALVDAVIPFMFADVVTPKRSTVTVRGKRLIRVVDSALDGQYPQYIRVIGDTVWLIEAEGQALGSIVDALP